MSIESKILDVLNKFGVEITSDIQNILQNNRAIATGDLYKSIDYKIVQKKGEYKLVISISSILSILNWNTSANVIIQNFFAAGSSNISRHNRP